MGLDPTRAQVKIQAFNISSAIFTVIQVWVWLQYEPEQKPHTVLIPAFFYWPLQSMDEHGLTRLKSEILDEQKANTKLWVQIQPD